MHLRVPAMMLAAGFAPAILHAQFHDQGMIRTPAVKTEYVHPKTGTEAEPLVLGECLWGGCRPERLVFERSNHWQQNLPCDPCVGRPQPDTYWTVLLNNEPRADLHNSGPPDASLPRAVPGEDLMGFQTLHGDDNFAGDTFWRAHLVLDFIGFDNPVFGGIPFLAFGEFSRRGNRDRPLGYLRPGSPEHLSVLSFSARLWEAVPPTPIPGGTQPATLASYVWVLAEWGTKPKAIFITLYHYNIQNSVPPGDPAIYRFSWPISQSALYPGAEIAYIDAEDLGHYCGFEAPSLALNQDVQYRIDLGALFACADRRKLFTEPMPTTGDIPVTEVLWANESTGIDGDLWIDVHDQKMLPAPAISGSPGATRAATAIPRDGRGARTIRAALARQCAAAPGCRDRAALAAAGRIRELELPIERQPSRPELLRSVPPPVAPGTPKRR